MSRVADIVVERSYNGTPAFIKFNYKKYGEILQSMFFERGLDYPVEEIPNAKTEAAIKELKSGKGKKFRSVEDLLADLKK